MERKVFYQTGFFLEPEFCVHVLQRSEDENKGKHRRRVHRKRDEAGRVKPVFTRMQNK